MPANHQFYAGISPESLHRMAARIGPNAVTLVEVILRERKHPVQGFRACLGILSLAKGHGPAALDAADIRHDLPAAALPFLVWEFGLEEITPWVTDLAAALRDGRQWQAIRGTPSSIAMALGWISAPLAAIEENPGDTWWDLFQLELSEAVSEAQLEPIIALTRLSRPAHSDLIRIYTAEWDERVLETDGDEEIDGGGMIDDWSGVYLRDGAPKISMGRRLAAHDALAAPTAGQGALTATSAAAFDLRHGPGWTDGPFSEGPWLGGLNWTMRGAEIETAP